MPYVASSDPARASAHQITMPFKYRRQILPTIACNKDAFPNRRRCTASRTKSFSLPKQAGSIAQGFSFLRKSSSAISGFRSLCGRERHSSSYCARMDLRFGTFHSAGSRFENSGLHPLCTYGASNPGPMLWPERSRSRGIFQGVFCVPIGLYRGILRPATARRMPARSALGGLQALTPQPSSKLSISPLWPCTGLHNQSGARRQKTRSLRDQRAIGVKSVGAAIERGERVVIAHFGGEACDIRRADIGRVRHDQIERIRTVPDA